MDRLRVEELDKTTVAVKPRSRIWTVAMIMSGWTRTAPIISVPRDSPKTEGMYRIDLQKEYD